MGVLPVNASIKSLGIDRLPIGERVALVEEIWDSIAALFREHHTYRRACVAQRWAEIGLLSPELWFLTAHG